MLGTAAAIFSTLLIATGVAKIRRPLETSRALVPLGLPYLSATGLTIGITEVAIGFTAILTSEPVLWALQGAVYSAFGLWVAVAIRRDLPIASCGCVGRDDTPPYWGHVALNLIGSFVSFGAALTAAPSLWYGPGTAIAQAAVVGAGAFLGWAIVGDGARLAGATKT